MTHKQIRAYPSTDFLRILSTLQIDWHIAISGNGGGSSILVELDDETDARLLAIWEELTALRFGYLATQPIQLALWEGGDHA